ncbi:MAG: ArnT family glycosyltransferase [Candidatus Moraniibacteriota bacterium]|jgi:hypothetical protein
MKNILKNKIFWIVLGIVLVGAFLRAYNFEDWMHYQLDQARDYRIVHAAMEYGPGELPLQGPRAAGSFLRLGPLLYYMEYGSALVFGDTPSGSVMIILILNILAIPLFYVFLRRFFDWKMAVGLTGIFAVSLFMIVYSRFGWNPTLIPFFMILFAYALLKTNDRINKNAGWWLVVAAATLAFIANMHFVAFVTVPVIAVIYFLWVRPWINFKWWFLAVAVFVFLNIPLIVNDMKTGGENFIEFIDVALNRSGDEEDTHNIVDKVVRNVGAHTQYYWLILTGDQFAGLPELKGTDIKCEYDCRRGLVRGVASFAMIFVGVVGWIWLYRIEEDTNKRDFLKLVAVWGVVVFLVYTPLAYDIAPRFFLLNAPLMFVLLGFVPKAIGTEYKKPGKIIAIVIIFLCIISNLFFVGRYFNELSQAMTNENFVLDYNDRILKEKTRITFEQMETISKWMSDEHQKNGYPIFIYAQPEYKRAFWERIDIRNIPRSHIPKDLDPLYRQGNYFVIVRTQSDQNDFLDKFTKGMDVLEIKNFGTLNVYKLKPREEFITAEKKVFEPKQRDPKFSKDVQPRYLWRQVFEGCTYNQKTDKCEQGFVK